MKIENRLKVLNMEDFPELTHLEARGNQLKDIGRLNTPKLQRLYLVIVIDNSKVSIF